MDHIKAWILPLDLIVSRNVQTEMDFGKFWVELNSNNTTTLIGENK